MINFIEKFITKNEDGVILLSVLLLSMVFLALGLTMLYQADTNFQMSAVTRDKVETFMTAETAYEAAASRMIYFMETAAYQDNFDSALPGDSSGWPNYLVRVYDDTANPQNFRLVSMPTSNYWSDDILNRDLSGQPDVTDDNANPTYFLINRYDSITSASIFRLEDPSGATGGSALHSYRAWFEADRLGDGATDDNTAFLMVEAFRGNPNSPINPNDPNYLPTTRVLMQYRVRLSRTQIGWESEDDSGSAAMGRGGTSASTSGGAVDITGSTRKRTATTGT